MRRLRQDWVRRPGFSLPLLSISTFLTAALASGCGQDDGPCTATATCAPISESEGGAGSRPDGSLGNADGRADASTDYAGKSDVARQDAPGDAVADGPPRDAAAADAPMTDRHQADGGLADTARLDVVTSDGEGDGSGPVDGAPADVAPVDGALADVALCELEAGRSPETNPCVVSERFGVFVSPLGSDATGAGTRAAPFRTVPRALQAAKAETRRVYACDDGTGYSDSVTMDATFDGMELFGGFDCAGWNIAGTGRSRIRGTTGPALTVRGVVAGVTIERFELAGADAAAGASSIAVLVETALNVTLRNVRIVAGRGGAGAQGAAGEVGQDGNAAGVEQDGAPSECNAPPQDRLGGAWSQTSVCGSRGGKGLASTNFPDEQAESGIPMTGVTPPDRWNGGGGFLSQPAGPGSEGNPGAVGVPTAASGTFTVQGYEPAPSGGAGTEGHTGQGGGGGVVGYTFVGCNIATGGAGGMGGCGGKRGLGGASGGASVGMLSWSSTVRVEKGELLAGEGGPGGGGGNGGSGGRGQPGGRGGAGFTNDAGTLATPAENGGPGGNGGSGGPGAGGNGGPSYALVYTGMRPTTMDTTLSRGAPGAAGVGGSIGGLKAPDGIVGVYANELML